jgi:uncharacterized protein (TIGR00730 family)
MKGIEMVVVEGEDLQERKRKMMDGADCLISLPGGVGTLDELFEAIANVHCGLSRLPICIVNVDGYYEGMMLQLERAKADGLLTSYTDLFHVATTPEVGVFSCSLFPRKRKEFMILFLVAGSDRVVRKCS